MDASTPLIDPLGLIEAYLGGTQTLRRSLDGLSLEQMRAHPIPGTWSCLQVLGHLVDSEIAWCHRIQRVASEPRPLLIGYDETHFAATLGYQDLDPARELDLIDRLRARLAGMLRGLPAEAWTRTGVHSERGLITLAEMVRVEAEHIHHHVRFLEAKRAAMGLAPATT
ncbi:DinB family protein [Isosphaeraceae bacterium EP7]